MHAQCRELSPTSPSGYAGQLVCGGGLEDSNADGERIPFDECIWCTSASAQSWLADNTGLDLDSSGFIAIDDNLQSTNTPNVFAAGDVAGMINYPRPKAGVFAVRQGPPLAVNLRALLDLPQCRTRRRRTLGLISTGDKYAALAQRHRWIVRSLLPDDGRRAVGWKDHIDRTWIAGTRSFQI